LLERLLGYRVFPDVEGKMNRSLQDIGGGLLLVPQFTLAADTRKGMRPSLTPAADPGAGERVRLSRRARTGAPPVDFSRRRGASCHGGIVLAAQPGAI
jgi:D-tyrosyl-tRNA(Tyr) deacylase